MQLQGGIQSTWRLNCDQFFEDVVNQMSNILESYDQPCPLFSFWGNFSDGCHASYLSSILQVFSQEFPLIPSAVVNIDFDYDRTGLSDINNVMSLFNMTSFSSIMVNREISPVVEYIDNEIGESEGTLENVSDAIVCDMLCLLNPYLMNDAKLKNFCCGKLMDVRSSMWKAMNLKFSKAKSVFSSARSLANNFKSIANRYPLPFRTDIFDAFSVNFQINKIGYSLTPACNGNAASLSDILSRLNWADSALQWKNPHYISLYSSINVWASDNSELDSFSQESRARTRHNRTTFQGQRQQSEKAEGTRLLSSRDDMSDTSSLSNGSNLPPSNPSLDINAIAFESPYERLRVSNLIRRVETIVSEGAYLHR